MRAKRPDGVRVRQLEEDKLRLQARVSELEEEVSKLGRDLKVLAVRNREVGTGRDEVVKRLEGEIERCVDHWVFTFSFSLVLEITDQLPFGAV